MTAPYVLRLHTTSAPRAIGQEERKLEEPTAEGPVCLPRDFEPFMVVVNFCSGLLRSLGVATTLRLSESTKMIDRYAIN